MAWINKQYGRRGTAAVEAALILPLLMLLLLGVIEYGWIYLKSEQIANAARHGARVGARNAWRRPSARSSRRSCRRGCAIPASAS